MFNNITKGFTKKPLTEAHYLYTREKSPSALQGWLFTDETVESVYASLAGSGLTWIWESTRTGPPVQAGDEEASPEHRDRRLLIEDEAAILQEDLLEKNLHGFRRFVALYGGDERLQNLTGDEELHDAVEAFADGKDGPVRTLIVQFGDVAADVAYFTPGKDQAVESLLHSLGLPPVETITRLPYKSLKGEDLETTMTYLSCSEHDH